MSDQPADRRDYLIAARDILETRMRNAPDAYVAGIVKQLASVLKELDELPNGEAEVTPLDLIRSERAAQGASGAGRRNQPRRRGRLQAG